ncbi:MULTISPECIES: hypothetical protein [Amycolatopsis]|uniref:hypothetical protein n=1 Tax=Amycolatopsis TaxID=1813 RepID=UPI001E300261|nr:hypothetical protein [Amycolatopsis bullii]
MIVSTPVLGAAGTASCPCPASQVTRFLPIKPVPPITTTFMGPFPPSGAARWRLHVPGTRLLASS